MTTEGSIELVMSEFGRERKNAGGNAFVNSARLDPTLASFRALFPHATVTVYTDDETLADETVRTVRVEPPFLKTDPRYGWRAHDYYQAFGMLESKADVAIAMDSDMLIVSPDFSALTSLASIFGLAAPLNARLLLRIDGQIGSDSTYELENDPTQGLGVAFNLTPLAFSTKHVQARLLLQRYCELLVKQPGRGAVHLAAASYELGYHPCVLPPQWCVCSPRDLDSKHLWREAIALHVGHADVAPRWRRERIFHKLKRMFSTEGKRA